MTFTVSSTMLVITGYYETLDLFQEIDYCENLLSILDPETPSLKPQLSHFVDHFRELYFHDISQPEEGLILPNRYHIDQIIQWARECASKNAIILSGAGMGRSPAAALIAMCEWGYPIDRAVETVLDLKPLGSPNRFMLKLYGNKVLEDAAIAAGFYEEDVLFEHSPLYIFLDIDGVLIREENHNQSATEIDDYYKFTPDCLAIFEKTLRPYKNYRIVVSSAWGSVFSLAEIRSYFPPDVAENVVGTMPITNDTETYFRYRDVLQYLEENKLKHTSWVAIDDIAHHYPSDTSLITIDGKTGFDLKAAKALKIYLEMVS
ncbi:MAG: HAD domain-containing protein [Microcystaceae cyanobacterium]